MNSTNSTIAIDLKLKRDTSSSIAEPISVLLAQFFLNVFIQQGLKNKYQFICFVF